MPQRLNQKVRSEIVDAITEGFGKKNVRREQRRNGRGTHIFVDGIAGFIAVRPDGVMFPPNCPIGVIAGIDLDVRAILASQ